MSNVNVENLLCLFILVSLIEGIISDWDYGLEQWKIVPRQRLQNNFTKIQRETVITSTAAITVDDEKFDDYELKKLFVKNFKLYENLERAKYETESTETCPRRKSRAVRPMAEWEQTVSMECHKCYATGKTLQDEQCYKGKRSRIVKCADAESCFTEINPIYVKRGCILIERVNRTFVCKCPLCNDKSTADALNYEYATISDWAYDNIRLSKRLLGMDLICKVCQTRGIDLLADQNCRSGKSTEFTVCPHNNICYTNIDDETDFVSRGCIPMPAFNSIFFFCNTSRCNKDAFLQPKLRIQKEVIQIKKPGTNFKTMSALDTNGSSAKQTLLMSLIIVTLGQLMTYFCKEAVYV